MSRNDSEFDRRSVLKTIGATAFAGAGLGAATGSASAVESKRRLTRGYRDEFRLRTAFEQHGAGLRAALVDAGFVADDFDFGSVDFELDANVTGLEPTSDDRRAGVTAVYEDGTPTAFGMVSTSSDAHEISLYVQPERDEAYALVEPKAGDDRFIVLESGVTPQGCSYQSCGSCCDSGYSTLKTYNCDPNCQNCSLYDTDCGCSDDGC